jgi:DNA-binding transcriptional LysR family regulator
MSSALSRLNWDDLKLFSAVARTGNFTRAAHELRLTGTTVGRRVQRLERELGLKLFTHSGSDAQLTDDGKRVLAHVTAAEHAIMQAGTPAPLESAVCRLMCSDGLAGYWLPQFLPAFMERHPNIDLALFSTPDRYSTRLPLFDLRIQYTESGSEDLVCARVGTMHFMLFAAQRYIDAHGTISHLSDLANHRLLDLALDVAGQGNLAAWTKQSYHNALLTNVNGALCETVRHGGGIGLIPTFAKLFEPALIPVLPQFRLPTPLYVCYDRENAKRPAVRSVLDYLRTTIFNQQTMPWFAIRAKRRTRAGRASTQGSWKTCIRDHRANGRSACVNSNSMPVFAPIVRSYCHCPM